MKRNFTKLLLSLCLSNFLHATDFHSADYLNKFDFLETHLFLRQFIRPGDLVFDVGAHTGKLTDIYLSLGAKVVCFEPQDICFKVMENKYSNNPKVTLERKGLSSKAGLLLLFQSSESTPLATFSYEFTKNGRFAERNFAWDKQAVVEVCTLDAMIAKHGTPQFCKIDVENYEHEVLKGLSQPIRCISFEYTIEGAEKNAKVCLELLTKLGYKKFNFAIAERGKFTFSQWLTADELYEQLTELSKNKVWKDIWGLWGDIYALYE